MCYFERAASHINAIDYPRCWDAFNRGRFSSIGFLTHIVVIHFDSFTRLRSLSDDQCAFHAKRFMRVAIGCTGGKHRSVAMTEEVTRRLVELGLQATATHRDLGRE